MVEIDRASVCIGGGSSSTTHFFDFAFFEHKNIIYIVKERKINKKPKNGCAYWSLSITPSSGTGHDQLVSGGTYAGAADGGGGGVAHASGDG
jgi:hypothetical protein